MGFVERMPETEVTVFANILRSIAEESTQVPISLKDQCHFLILRDKSPLNLKEEKGGWVIGIYFDYDKQYNITLRAGDYDIIAYQVGNLSRETIRREYLRFMYREFGEEYKKAYMEEAAKILY